MKITEKSKRALITRLINRFLSNGTSPTKKPSLEFMRDIIFHTRNLCYYRASSWKMPARFSGLWWNGKLNLWEGVEELAANVPILGRREREYKRRRRGWKDFRTNHFSRLFDKLLLCSTTLLPLESRTSNRREGRKEERGTRPICESVLHKIARLLETSVCLCVRKSGTWIHLEAWLDSAWKKRRKKHG